MYHGPSSTLSLDSTIVSKIRFQSYPMNFRAAWSWPFLHEVFIFHKFDYCKAKGLFRTTYWSYFPFRSFIIQFHFFSFPKLSFPIRACYLDSRACQSFLSCSSLSYMFFFFTFLSFLSNTPALRHPFYRVTYYSRLVAFAGIRIWDLLEFYTCIYHYTSPLRSN